jgi:hypothetical protein
MKNFYNLILAIFLLLRCQPVLAQNGEMVGIPWTGTTGITETVAQIMARNVINQNIICKHAEPELQMPDRTNLSQNPLALPVSNFPVNINTPSSPVSESPQTIGTSFTAATLSGTGSFPPDNMGAVGPTQYIISVNGIITSYNKTTGLADGGINTTQDNFFSAVMTPPVATNFTSDPRIRYDRKTQKWFFLIIDVPGGNGALPNRVLLAVSNSSTITAGTSFTYFFFQQDLVTPTGNTGQFADYPTLGVDDNALYIGCNMFSAAGAFTGTSAFVVRKSSILGAGPIVVSAFRGLVASSAGAGPYTPQGVDNLDASSTDGYFIGVDNATFSTLMLRRVTNPGTTPVLSANISLTVPTTASPLSVPHLGNTGGTSGNLDALDDRLFAAVQRNGHIWTSHNIKVNTSGVGASTGTRNGSRWYDIINFSATPALNQSGTIFDNAATNPVFYSIPSVMVSGQGHAAFALTSAGAAARSNASTVGRLAGDVTGTTGTIVNTSTSATAYNPPGDNGVTNGSRRWGDYSYVSLDPLDDQTMWMVNQFCDALNSYGCRVTRLIAPPPATPASCNPALVAKGLASVNVIVTGTSAAGSGFYDPGTNLAGALPFNHISATVTGGVVVNSVTYTDPTHITLNLNTVGAAVGNSSITVTNPDGQSATSATAILGISVVTPVRLLDLKGKLSSNLQVLLTWNTASENNNKGFYIERNESDNLAGWTSLGFVQGAGNSNILKNYSFEDKTIELNKIYRYRLKQMDINGNVNYSTEVVIRVKDLQKSNLFMNVYPNPATANSTIRYNLPKAGMMSLKLYDILGKEIATIESGFQQQGAYFNRLGSTSYHLTKGVYLCKLSLDGETVSTKIMIVD